MKKQKVTSDFEMEIDLLTSYISKLLDITIRHFPDPSDGIFYTTSYVAWLAYKFSKDEFREHAPELVKNIFDEVYKLLLEQDGNFYIQKKGSDKIQ